MIFVTVGTHEQQFDRLIKKIDELKKDGFIKEEVFIQTGYSDYEPKYCKWSKLIPYKEMEQKVKEAAQSAMVIIDHKTGYVVGAVGALGEKGAGNLNRVTQIRRQPGSSIKPIAVYGYGICSAPSPLTFVKFPGILVAILG